MEIAGKYCEIQNGIFDINLRKKVDFVLAFIEPMLYIDHQMESRILFCGVCGGECYAPGFRCIRCERSAP